MPPDTMTEEQLNDDFRQDPETGLSLMHIYFGARICRFIESVAWNLQPEDIMDIYQTTMAEMVEVIRKPAFDREKPPLQLAQTIARRRAIDALRRRGHQPKQDLDGALDRITEDTRRTKVGIKSIEMSSRDKRKLREDILNAAHRLPPKMATVARVYVDIYEDLGERDVHAPLAKAVGKVTGKVENVATVKTQWHEAKRRIADDLKPKYTIMDLEDMS
jgi:DNA-directed RNA polymerase specialized sigma24 family protein